MRFILLFLMGCSLGCNNEAQAPLLTEDSAKPDGTELNDTIVPAQADTATASMPTKAPLGFYRATLPCDGCTGIEHTILFQADKTYLLEENRLGKTPIITKTTGQYNPSSGIIWAYKGQLVKARYTWSADTLYYLLPNNKRLAMQKLTAATDNDVWRRKGKEGMAFYGVGNEPFWNLEIGQQKTIAFHQAEWTTPLRFTNSTSKKAGDSLIYTASTDSATLKAVIYNRFCSDGMSDFMYSHSLQVIYNGKTFSGCGILY